MNFAGINITGGDTYSNSTTQLHPLSTEAKTKDGRWFKYCAMGAVDAVARCRAGASE